MNAKADPLRWRVFAMAVTTAITIANVYYCQPILSKISDTLGATDAQIGNLPVLTQVGVGMGLLFLAPLGDMLDRKKLVICLELLLVCALLGMSVANTLATVYAASFAIGVFAVAVQIVVPMAASMATAETKGKIVGTVFTGTLTGILVSRIASGYLADWLGWRSVYIVSAALVFGVSLLILAAFPSQPGRHQGSYGGLMASTLSQFFRFAKLRRLSLLGALIFGAFCSFWTTLTFHLSMAPFSFDSSQIGLFGFVAIAGTLFAPFFGRLADRSSPERMQTLTIFLMILGVLCGQWWQNSTIALIAATLLLDIGVQATQVNNLAQIYKLDETAHSRINSVFMVCFFIGGAIGSYCGVWAWSAGGWPFVSGQLLAFSVFALLVSILNLSASKRPSAPHI
ncbi:MFS transporter [Rhizobium sp. 16-449-1b]|uniref:MFS transporter n=1 Tax=Rhizobium sp. 16-449-1b TaxID=2819989 RepID=UPI001ADD1D30|nr:MFS transporter [Rhizobium sp. 16-449-1b]MBO9196882.1 MFS transporter [Rhizobium sp. 16-449-1b]